MAPRGGRSRKVGLKRIDAAIDALKPMGFSPEITRRNVNKLLKEYGEEGWPFIEDGYYKLLIDFTLDEEDKKVSCEQGESSLRESPNEDGQQGSEQDETQDAGLSGEASEASELLCCNHGTVIATPIADITLASPDPVVVRKPMLSPTENATSPREIATPIKVNQTNELLMDQESSLPFPSIYALPAPPGFEHIPHQEKVAPCKRRPSLGWIGSKDDDNFALLTPAPVLSWRAEERQRKRKSKWDV